jgi:hypothetical protein
MTVEAAEVIDPVVMRPVRHAGITRGGKPDAAFGVRLPGRDRLVIRVRQRE